MILSYSAATEEQQEGSVVGMLRIVVVDDTIQKTQYNGVQ